MTPQELREKSEKLLRYLATGDTEGTDDSPVFQRLRKRQADAIESFAREIRNEALEDAANRCDREGAALDGYGYIASSKIALSCATWIRAMKINIAEVINLKESQ